ncbi:hypothetical protein H2248_008122 [Termitomyces sp. 'cryptogamus']|nr:hypothetical protein H2248_008122 [Termitomyces sp. 'cryptogamus']
MNDNDDETAFTINMNSDEQHTYGLPETVIELVDEHTPALLPLTRFAHLHLQHILSHPPDSVLFPFLHGLEGDNDAQNTFFASSSGAACLLPLPSGTTLATKPSLNKCARVPRYRGLVWVICEDDLEAEPRRYARELSLLRRKREGDNGGLGTPVLEGDSESGVSSDCDDEDDEDDVASPRGAGMEAKVDVVPPDAMDVDGEVPGHGQAISFGVNDDQKDEEKHMHPVIQRSVPIQTANLPSPYPSINSDLSISLTTSDGESFLFSPLSASLTSTPEASSIGTKSVLTTAPEPNPSTVLPTAASKPAASATTTSEGVTVTAPDLALLTCTFRPSEIVQKAVGNDAEEGWEFVPAKVPDGISLRNFGIQVPIYTTLSDIVVYSPKGPSPNARVLARRIQEAIQRQYRERANRLGGTLGEDGLFTHPDLLHYNVFILDATVSDMQADTGIPHLIMRLCVSGVPGSDPIEPGTSKPNDTLISTDSIDGAPLKDGANWGAHTDGPDGHLVVMEAIEDPIAVAAQGQCTEGMYVDIDSDMDMDMDPGMNVDGGPASHARLLGRLKANAKDPNTVDFAQREREEMRDLTKASEIISVPPPDGMEGHANHVMTSTPLSTGIGIGSVPGQSQSSSVLSMQALSPTVWMPHVGQVFLGNSDDVPHRPHPTTMGRENGAGEDDPRDPFDYLLTNDPAKGFGFDICIECHDLAPFPTPAELRAAEEHLMMLDDTWVKRVVEKREREGTAEDNANVIPPRPPPHASSVIHLSFPSSPSNAQISMNVLMAVIHLLEKWLMPVVPTPPSPPQPSSPLPAATSSASPSRRWSSVAALMPHLPSFPLTSSSTPIPIPSPAASRTRSFTSPAGSLSNPSAHIRTRPVKVLLYSADGYTESSLLALCLLMAVKHLTLPEAYLELQVARRRSFFVYHADLGLLRRVESKLREDVEREKERAERERERARVAYGLVHGHESDREVHGNGKRIAATAAMSANGSPGTRQGWGAVMENKWGSLPSIRGIPLVPSSSHQLHNHSQTQTQQVQHQHMHMPMGRPAAKSVSFGHGASPIPLSPPLPVTSVQSYGQDRFVPGTFSTQQTPHSLPKGRPRANTSPWLPSFFGDHQSWFNDPRFDGSFPSRVLPFLYLGNLNHAANAFMLHALGITHVVSVGECALIPPPHHVQGHGHYAPPPYHHPGPFIHGKGAGHGSLWYEEREGRIKVLDIKGVCDDGIDTLEPQLEPICDWIDQARAEGGQVLVHCRVGVSRSATVTIAYVMKHLGLPLVDAYLIVRSRRLSVLIQPNMRLLYNLCGWEIKLAKARAGNSEENLRNELARTLSWPYLAKEVHALNEKYLH